VAHPWVCEHWLDDAVRVEFPEGATFDVSSDRIELIADHAGDADLMVHLLLDHVLPRVLALRGDVIVHASGVVAPSGGAHLFMGASGSGKSTLAVALAREGWSVLNDDGIRLLDRQGTLWAVPGYPGHRLLSDAAATVCPQLISGPRLARDSNKRRYILPGHSQPPSGPAPVAAAYLLGQSYAGCPQVERVGIGEAIVALVEHVFSLTDEPSELNRRAFEAASSVAAAVPIWRLAVPHDFHELAATVAAIAGIEGAVSGQASKPSIDSVGPR
jgi:hypothetical protein